MRIILSTHPTENAHSFAEQLVNEGLAGCIQVQERATSIYRWQGATHREVESLLTIKTPTEMVSKLRARFLELHPYEVPEFLPLSVDETLANQTYLDWLRGLDSNTG